MNPGAVQSTTDPYIRHPREIAAAVTLPAAAVALTAPGPPTVSAAGAAAITTACGALATRIALVRHLADPNAPEPRRIRPYDPIHEGPPLALRGSGPAPDAEALRVAGERCAATWRAWRAQGAPDDERIGVAGALALGAWCAWALGSGPRAEVRARHALETDPHDPMAALVLRSVLADSAPAWHG